MTLKEILGSRLHLGIQHLILSIYTIAVSDSLHSLQTSDIPYKPPSANDLSVREEIEYLSSELPASKH